MTDDVVWTLPPRDTMHISAVEVHVWRASLVQSRCHFAQLAETLSREERTRADQFRFRVHRDRFIARRGLQRSILSSYLDVPPAALEFRTMDYGKPEVARAQASSGLRFSVSNSGPRALFAIAANREVGVDLEEVQHFPGALSIARSFFSPREIAELRSVSSAKRDLAFARCWTRKEAYVKAIGGGLSLPLDTFDVTAGQSYDWRSSRQRTEIDRWVVETLDVGDGFVGALAVEGRDWRLRLFELKGAE